MIEIGAKEKKTEKPSDKNIIKDVHIGVFFDGTNNNMVQQAYFHTYRQLDEKAKNNELTETEQRAYEGEKESYKIVSDTISLRKPTLEKDKDTDTKKEKISRKDRSKALESYNVSAHFDAEFLKSDHSAGYSNIAILHSLINRNIEAENACYHNIYIEGSGANNIAASKGKVGFKDEANINGLGFGLGKTGVTALVSKAIKYIRKYLLSTSGLLSPDTNYHFYVFGFSRGATCARLFAELATRAPDSRLKCEKEFGQPTSKIKDIYCENNRVPFMETDFLNGVTIDRNKVTVDFLGIYDTVSSIGFLKQKDGWTNALSLGYRSFAFNNYHGNFHYQNAKDYGLYSHHNSNVKHTLHICAADEFRENFALVNLGKKLPGNAMEIIIPGCHSDVGGGYISAKSILFILYKVITRKKQRLVKAVSKVSSTAMEFIPDKGLAMAYAPFSKADALLSDEKRARVFVSNPMSPPTDNSLSVLNTDSLIKLGWIDKNFAAKGLTVQDNDLDISFNRDEKEGYSNIPLKMMMACVKECGITWLFKEDTSPYDIPESLKNLGKNMISVAQVEPKGARKWLMPDGDYSGELYQSLRLNFLHFTSSCEIFNEGAFTPHFGNFGNNCNYDNDVNICRIMYFGDKELDGDDAADNVHYMYEYDKYGMELSCVRR